MWRKNPTPPLIKKIPIKTKQLMKTEKLSGITAEGELELEAAGRNDNGIEISRRHAYNSSHRP